MPFFRPTSTWLTLVDLKKRAGCVGIPAEDSIGAHELQPAVEVAAVGFETLGEIVDHFADELGTLPGAHPHLVTVRRLLDIRAVGEADVGEVGLPGLIGQGGLEALTASLPALSGRTFGPLTVATADSFSYTDPVDGSTSANQGLRVLFEGGSRIVFRLSGTGTEGATLRVYLERYEPVGGDLGRETPDMLADLISAAEAIAGIAHHTGRSKPDVVT